MYKKIEIFPAINEVDFDEVVKKVNLILPYSDWVHIDAADGSFTSNILWHNPKDLENFNFKINLEAHLMMRGLEEKVENWLNLPLKRIIFNLESAENPDLIIEKCKAKNIETGISIGPDTQVEFIFPFLESGKINFFQILSVYPGLSGQKFIESSLDKIRSLKEICPECTVEVDGGVNNENAKQIIEAGTDILVSSSYVFNGGVSQVKDKLESLKTI